MRRRDFLAGLGSAAAWPAGAQQAMPVVGFVNGASADASAERVRAFHQGLGETGYVDGRNVTVEHHWLEGKFERLPSLMVDLVRRRVAVIATPGSTVISLAAQAASSTIPIVFGVGDDPVKVGLVASVARPGSNATGINFFTNEVAAKRLGILHELVPKASRIAMLVNPTSGVFAEKTVREVREAARIIGLQIQILNASTSSEIDAAFATLARERLDALFVGPDAFFASRRVQLVTLTARDRIPAAYGTREIVEAGGLMSYGTSFADTFRQVGTCRRNPTVGHPCQLGQRSPRWHGVRCERPRRAGEPAGTWFRRQPRAETAGSFRRISDGGGTAGKRGQHAISRGGLAFAGRGPGRMLSLLWRAWGLDWLHHTGPLSKTLPLNGCRVGVGDPAPGDTRQARFRSTDVLRVAADMSWQTRRATTPLFHEHR